MNLHWHAYRGYVGLLLMAGLLYWGGGRCYFRLDLTEDQRYSLHPATKSLLRTLEEEVHVEIYLEGDLPAEFKQLRKATQELLEEWKVHARRPLRYQFVHLDQLEPEPKKDHLRRLAAQGIQPTNLFLQTKGQRTEKFIFPGALLTYKGQESGVLLLKGNKMVGPAQMINQSIESLEYELVSALQQLVGTQRKSVALLRGHGEPERQQLHGLTSALEERYTLHIVDFSAQSTLTDYDALLITQPQQPFTEAEKYLLDQYIMQGGKVLFFLDQLRISMEHLRRQEAFAFPLDLGLDDQLFRYGVRINTDLVQDLHAGVYPVVAGRLGNQPQIKLLPWPFFPLVNYFASHLITKNMDVLYPQFVSSIDKIQVQGVTHTPLVFTSQYARRLGTPVHVDLEALRETPDKSLYHQGPLPLAYLLEGTFPSLYKNRFLPEGIDATHFLMDSAPTKLLVMGSGSLVLNGWDRRKNQPLPWGYDPFLQQHFANPDFVLNALAYMLQEEGLINVKNKELKVRLLDPVKITQDRLFWQLVNLLAPLVALLLLGLAWNYGYKKAYTKGDH
ncbi:MAG: gliding motility-associated ABC transporter substrate-binding protein GldG [Roseivirga sp.]